MLNKEVMFSSKSDEWTTPQYLYDALNEEFNFTLDVCATASNHKMSNYYTQSDSGLQKQWHGTCFMNPPYSEVKLWIKKAWEDYKTVRDNRNKAIRVSNTTSNYKTCFIDSMEYDHFNSVADFTVWIKE